MGRPRLAKHPKIAVMEPEDISQEAPESEPVFPLETGGFASANKSEAVRTALAEGLEELDDIHDFVKAKFGHDMPKTLISSYKSRLGGAKKAAQVAPKAATKSEPTGKSMNKSEAARAAIDAGYDKPATALPWIKETFGVEIGGQHFSAIKSQYLKKQAEEPAKTEPAKRGRKPKAVTPAVQAPVTATPKATPAANGHLDVLDALTAMKPLIAQFGADKVKQMVDLLG
jgi:hypothetical protein